MTSCVDRLPGLQRECVHFQQKAKNVVRMKSRTRLFDADGQQEKDSQDGQVTTTLSDGVSLTRLGVRRGALNSFPRVWRIL